MNNHRDIDLERLFKTAKVVRPDMTELEAGFEDRISARFRVDKRKETLLSVWTWRLAPIMAIPLLILVVLSAVVDSQESHDIFSPIIDTYEKGQITMYLTGE
jgi:hypothetical protein